MAAIADDRGRAVAAAAAAIGARLGSPAWGVVLGSGFGGVADALGAGPAEGWPPTLGVPDPVEAGARRGVRAATVDGRRVWLVHGRIHLYEGVDARLAALPAELLAAAGADAVLLTCAAGGLREDDRPGTFAVVRDHLNLTGDDPVRRIAPARRDPPFPDVADAYDAAWSDRLEREIRGVGGRVRRGILAAVPGPSYETAAEVRMMRVLGADLASMSIVPEVLLARHLGLRVAALACIANRGAGLGAPIHHDGVLATVEAAVARSIGRAIAGASR
jgi:inosine/guanosine/xanthosine phosphorylase family protein